MTLDEAIEQLQSLANDRESKLKYAPLKPFKISLSGEGPTFIEDALTTLKDAKEMIGLLEDGKRILKETVAIQDETVARRDARVAELEKVVERFLDIMKCESGTADTGSASQLRAKMRMLEGVIFALTAKEASDESR